MRQLIDTIGTRRFLVIGDAMLDHYVWGDAHRISPEAPVPIVRAERDSFAAGGAANVALNLRALGAQVRLAARIGDDPDGQRLRSLLHHANVSVREAHGSIAASTIVKTRIMCRNQQICRLDREDSPDAYRLDVNEAKTWLDAEVDNAHAILFSDYAKGTITSELIDYVLARAQAAGAMVSLDPKPRPDLVFRGVDLMTPNRAEALQLAGLPSDPLRPFPTEMVCARIHARYTPRVLVITMGAEGMLISPSGRQRRQIPTMAREVFDVSGAGDTVIASLTAALTADADIDKAVRFANIAAGIVVGKVGAATATPREIIEFESSPS